MERRTLGRTGISVSALGLGTVELGTDYGIRKPGERARPSESDAIALLVFAADKGVDFFDTAPGYGEAERLLGQALGRRNECRFSTKVSVPRGSGGERLHGAEMRRGIETSLASSCRMLGREVLDVVLIHNATVDVIVEGELAEVLLDTKARGQVRAIGASVYTEAEALAAIEVGCIDVLQVAFSLLDQRMLDRVFPAAREAGVAVVARSALLKGALTPRARQLPSHLSELATAADGIREALRLSWEHLPAAALRYCWSSSDVATVIVGVQSVEELHQALTAAEAGPLDDSARQEAEAFALTDEHLLDPSRWGFE